MEGRFERPNRQGRNSRGRGFRRRRRFSAHSAQGICWGRQRADDCSWALNLDSDRAFEIANKQAIAKKVSFSWVDYSLRADAPGGSPTWVLRLYNNMGLNVGVTQISAENGSVMMPLQATAPPPTERQEQFSDSSTGRQIGGFIGRVGGTLENVGMRLRTRPFEP